MSKVGKKLIEIPAGITVTVEPKRVVVKDAKRELVIEKLRGINVKIENNELTLTADSTAKQIRSNWGTLRSLIQNAIEGLVKGYEKTLIVEGVGYKIAKDGNDLNLSLGFSHPVKYKAPENIEFTVEKNTILKIAGFDKALVGQVAAEIRALKKPEPYKGKGFRYQGEIIKRKAGKKAAAK
ncbi:MAG: 50S ribosomal protein L6 [bacterium]|nr:50S ribosomal protein L6 [Candidatus Jorgensenbacteria bacterium]